MTKMLFIQSEDYWGYDASSFDDAINFYKFAWVVPFSQYSTMSADDQKRLYPCALFYVAGVTDNHNFLTLKIVYDSTEAKVSGMEGTKRRTRRYEIGSNAQYSVGSYSLQAAPTSATTISEIKEAVESGSTSEGSFLISGFLDDAASVAKQVNYTEEKSAESFSAPITEPSGSSYEPADPTVANPSTEGPSESELITMSAEIEYAELGDESYPIVPNTTGQDSSFSGHGVPQWYGAEGSGDIDHDRIDREETKEVIFRYDHPMTFYDWSVDGEVTDEQIDEIQDGIYDELGTQPEEESNDFDVTLEDGRDTYVQTETQYGDSRFYGLAAEGEDFYQCDKCATIFEDKDVADNCCSACYNCGYTDHVGFERGQSCCPCDCDETGGGPDGTCQEMFDSEGLLKPCGDCGRPSTHSARNGTVNRCDRCWPGDDFAAEGGSRLRDIRGKFMNRRKAKNAVFGEVMSQQMGGYYRTGIVGNNPPVGQDISRRNPVAKAKYFVQPGVQNANSGAWSKGPNFQQARKIAKGVAWDTVQDMGLAAESFASEVNEFDFYQCDKCATAFEDEDAADYCCSACYACGYTDHVGFERGQKCCPCDCDETGGGPDGTCQEMFGSETTSFCADCGTTKKYRGEEEGCGCGSMSAEMEYAELGEELYPVVPNSEGGNTALDSGYGVPQWYGSAEGHGQLRFTTGFSRSSFGKQKMHQNYEVEYSVDYNDGPFTPEYRHAVEKLIEKDIKKELNDNTSVHHDLELALMDNKTFEMGNDFDVTLEDGKEAFIIYGATFMPNEIISEKVNGGETFYEDELDFEEVPVYGRGRQWHKPAKPLTEGQRRKITETLEEASPAKGTLVAPALAAIVGILGGIFYARRS